jgi:hypothetical protein
MIYEFALEPELAARWHDPREYFLFKETFGMKTGRFISAYPKKWKKMVYDAFINSPDGQNQNAQMRLTALLESLWGMSIKRKSSFPEMTDWLERAEAEHDERPFRAILATKNPRKKDFVIETNDLIDNGHQLWNIPDDPVVPRKAEELAKAVSPILKKCQWAIIVDPNFDPGKSRFRDTLERFLIECRDNNCGESCPQIELHTGIDRFFKSRDSRTLSDEQCELTKLTNNCGKYLPPVIPENMAVTIKVWKRKGNGQRLHNRYLLTDLASVSFGTGIDHAGNTDAEETDDISRLSETQHVQRLREYRDTPAAFDMVGVAFDIKGKKRVVNNAIKKKTH